MQAWQAGFNSEQPGVNFSYDPVGSGGGREQFLAGGVDFAGSDSALSDEELTTAADRCGDAGVFELPNYISAIAVVYNLDGVDDLNLSPATIAGIFNGTITTWNDPAIAADNPDAKLPSTAVTPVHRGDKSGTTKNFTDYLDKAAGDVWTGGAVDEWPIAGGEAANGTSGVIASVSGGQGTIGYADESQAGDLGDRQHQGRRGVRRPVRRGGRRRRRQLRPGRGPRRLRLRHLGEPRDDVGRRVPDRAGQLPHRLRRSTTTRRRPTRSRRSRPT